MTTENNGSFYVNGLAYGTAETGLGNVPASPTPTLAPSSFYQSGSVYNTLVNSDALLASITAQQALATASAAASQASNVASGVSAASSAASAAAATATLASSLLKANNLSDLTNATTARANLVLDQVNNTSDANKPVSTAQATANALVASNAATATALKANIASPAFTGVPTTAATPTALDNSLKLATTAYADAATSTLSGTVNTALGLKAPLASPALTGVPTAPTATVGTNTTQIATTQFVTSAVAAAGVSTIAGNSGAFTLSNGIINSTNDIRIDIGNIPGISGSGAAAAGKVGEVIDVEVLVGAAVLVASATPTTIMSITLTAGDWQVWGNLYTNFGGTVTNIETGISQTNNVLPTRPGKGMMSLLNFGSAITGNQGVPIAGGVIRLAAPATVYLVASVTGTVSIGLFGYLGARRKR